jgi:enoyl-CoA hydratase/carnithine racemase
MVDDAAQVFSAAALGSEGMEGIRAFIEKRDPAWVRA